MRQLRRFVLGLFYKFGVLRLRFKKKLRKLREEINPFWHPSWGASEKK